MGLSMRWVPLCMLNLRKILPASAFPHPRENAMPNVANVSVRLTSGDHTVATASESLQMTRERFLQPNTVEPHQMHVLVEVHVMPILVSVIAMVRTTSEMHANSHPVELVWVPRQISAQAREHAILLLDYALVIRAPRVVAVLKAKDAKIATTRSVKQIATATMECVTASLENVFA